MVQHLLDRKLRHLRKSNGRIEVASERYLRAIKWYYLSGFDGNDGHRSEASNETSLDAFLKMFKFQDAHDNVRKGHLIQSPVSKGFTLKNGIHKMHF